jgi:putative hemolysin
MNKKILIFLGVFLILFLSFLFYFSRKNLIEKKSEKDQKEENQTIGLPNPASVFCKKEGGEIEIRNFTDGQRGFCIFNDRSECDEWYFYRGECKKGERFCRDFCGDGICQEVVCWAQGCPCPETKENCLKDCGLEMKIP